VAAVHHCFSSPALLPNSSELSPEIDESIFETRDDGNLRINYQREAWRYPNEDHIAEAYKLDCLDCASTPPACSWTEMIQPPPQCPVS